MKIAEKKRPVKYLLILVAVVSLMACTAPKPVPQNDMQQNSSLVIKLSLEELVAKAVWIIVGTVNNQKSQWNAEHSQIYTLVTVTVEEWVKGEPRGTEIIIKIPGGQVGEIAQKVGSTPNFCIDEKVLVFLQIQEDNTMSVVGGWQGKFVIENGKIIGSDVSLEELIKQIKFQGNNVSK